MTLKVYSSNFKTLDVATQGGVHAGHPWLIIDEREKKVRDRWFPGARGDTGVAEKDGLTVVRDPSASMVRNRIGKAVLNDEALVVIVGFRSAELETMCSVVLRVSGGDLVMTKNSLGPKVRVRLPS